MHLKCNSRNLILISPAIAPTPPVQHGTSPVQLLAKYSFQANPDRPGEFDEMSLKQGEKVEFIKVHPNNPFWWEARNAMNQVAFVPASYMMVSLELSPAILKARIN